MIDTDKYEGHTPAPWARPTGHILPDARLITDAPLILAAYDKQVRWINDILFRIEKMQEASEEYRSHYLQTVYIELEMMIK